MFRFLPLYSRDLSEYFSPSLYPEATTGLENSWVGKSQLGGHEVSLVGEYWWLLQEMKLRERLCRPESLHKAFISCL